MAWSLTHSYYYVCVKCDVKMAFGISEQGWVVECPKCKYRFEIKERPYIKRKIPKLNFIYSIRCTKCSVEMVYVSPKSLEGYHYKCPKCNHHVKILFTEEKILY